jgi:ketosteroid isomerase-like protein
VISREQADLFAHEWIEAWNSHDLVRILGHYSEDFVMSSPRIASVAQEASGVLFGKSAVAAYWAQALALRPKLHFTLLATYVGADSVAIHYESVRGQAVEVFFFNESGLVCRASAHYL